MKKFLARLLLTALALLAIPYFVPGVSVSTFYTAIIVALIFAFLNLLVRPILVVLTLPINILTLGLFTLVINALIFWFVSTFVQGFVVSGFLAAFVGALVLSVVSYLIEKLI